MTSFRAFLLAAGGVLLLVLPAACASNEAAQAPSPGGIGGPSISSGVGPSPGSSEPILLGMTADVARQGNTPFGAIAAAAQSYFAKVNQEEGGVCGRQISLLVEDDQYNPDLALQKTKALVEQQHVLAMIGGVGTAVQLPAAAYLTDPNNDGDKADGIPNLFLSSGWSAWGDPAAFPWAVVYAPDFVTDARVLITYVQRALPGQKIGALYQNDEMGRDYLAGAKLALSDPALLAGEQPFETAEADLAPKLGALRDAGATVVLLAAAAEQAVKAFDAAGRLDYHPQFLLSYTNSPSRLASLIGGGDSAQQLTVGFEKLAHTITTAYLLSHVANVDTAAMQEHQRIMTTFAGPPLSSLTIYAQSLAELVVKTLASSCDDLTREGLRKAAEGIRGFRSSLLLPGIEVTLAQNDHYAIQEMQPVEIRADGTVKEVGQSISFEQQ